MNHILKASIFLATLLFVACNNQPPATNSETSSELIFPKGRQITGNNFTGTVWFTPLVEADSLNPNAVGCVTFEPGARTNWHLHPKGQIIVALSGTGFYQEQGSPKVILHKGDVVKCPPGKQHWHGASPEEPFIQVAITGRELGPTKWFQPVTDEEYLAQEGTGR